MLVSVALFIALVVIMANMMPFSLIQRMREMRSNPDPTPSSEEKETVADEAYSPTTIDIVVTRIMMTRGKKLPPDIVDAIFDQAEYWAHSSNEIDYIKEHNSALRITGTSPMNNRFLIRSFPVGLTAIDGDKDKTLAEILAYDVNGAKPLPLVREHDANFFRNLANYPTPSLASPVRKIVFTIKSKDQGWVSVRSQQEVYKHSWTWFEAGLERFDADQICGSDCTYDVRHESNRSTASPLPVCALRSLQPEAVPRNVGNTEYGYEHPLHGPPKYVIQRNKTGNKAWQTHVVTWSHTDDIAPESDDGLAREENHGQGRDSGDGSFIRDLKMGDVITIWGKARFGGWSNNIEKVKIDVYWSV